MKPLRILVSSPLCFEPPPPELAANAFEILGRELYEADPVRFRETCVEEHSAEISALTNGNLASTIQIPHAANMPDSVFTRDGSINVIVKSGGVRTPMSIIGNFTNRSRFEEAEMHRRVLETLDTGSRMIYQSPYPLEGGDIQLDPTRKIFWGGYHPDPRPENAQEGRTSLNAHAFISEKTGIPVASLRTWNPRYHIDTFLGVAPKGELVVCFDGMAKGDRDRLMDIGFHMPNLDPKDYLIEVSAEEADKFATNFLGLRKDHIMMPMGNDRLASIFTERGYNVRQLSMRYIGAGGGSSHCSTNEIDTEIDLDEIADYYLAMR